METQDSTKCFLYDILRVETISELEAYIVDGKGTLDELKDCFRTPLSKLTVNERKEIDTVDKLVEALEGQSVIGAKDVKFLKLLAVKIGLEVLKQKVEEYEADCAGIFRSKLNAAKRAPDFIWDRFRGTVIHLKTEISVRRVLLTLAGATFIGIYGMDLENLKPFVDFGARLVALFRG